MFNYIDDDDNTIHTLHAFRSASLNIFNTRAFIEYTSFELKFIVYINIIDTI